jgi:ferredoxin
MIEIEVLTERCISSGNCVDLAPDLFEMDDDGLVHALEGRVDDSRRRAIEQAADVCPVQAILLSG